MRDEFFTAEKTIDPSMLSNVDQLRSKISEIRMRLASGKSALESATTETGHFSAVLNLKETLLAAGVASATAGCIVSAEACKPAVRASVVLYEMTESASTSKRAQAQREISTLEPMLQTIQDKITDSIAQQSKQRFYVVLSGMCEAIKQQCK
jgi:hypothetical protein